MGLGWHLTITLMMRGVTAQCQWICSRPTWPLSSMASLELERVSKSMRITVDPYSGGDRSPTNFFRIGQNSEKYFLKIKTSTIKSAKNIYQTIHSTSFIFNFFGIFTIFFVFFPIFWKFKFHFLKKLQLCSVVPAHRHMQYLGELVFFHTPLIY